MGFNIGALGAAFKGQQEYEQYLQAKKIRDMQIAQMQAQNDPKSLEMAWNTMQQENQPVPPMPGQASMPSRPPQGPVPPQGPQMPQGGPQPNGPMPQQGMGAPAPPIPPYKPMPTGGAQNQLGAAPRMPQGIQDAQMPDQGGYAPAPKPQGASQATGMLAPNQPDQQSAPSGPPVELKHNMTLQDAKKFIQQNYADATPAQKFQALEKVHSFLSADAKVEFQEKQLQQKALYENALVDIKKQVATTDESYKQTKGELLKTQADLTKEKALSEAMAIRLNLAERKVQSGEKNAEAATIKAGAAVTAANASASRAATTAAGGGSDGTDKLTPEGRAVRDARAMAGLPTFKAKRGQVDYDLYNSLGKSKDATSDILVKPAEYKANASSLAATQKRADAIDLGSKKIPLDINTMLGTLDKGAAGSWKVTNEPLNVLRTKFSDPDLRPFALAVRQVGTEYERLLTGGMLSSAQLHAGAAEDAKKILNEDMSPAEIKKTLPIMLQEIKNAKIAANQEIKEIKDRMRNKKSDEEPAALPSGWTVKEH